VIDPNGVLRAMLYYPMSNGRSIDEILRLVRAMQTSDTHKVATPENWQPGDKVIVPPPVRWPKLPRGLPLGNMSAWIGTSARSHFERSSTGRRLTRWPATGDVAALIVAGRLESAAVSPDVLKIGIQRSR